ncbi:hypothetical protein MRX96_030142 [Rhipicephalus microplus]
MVCYVSVPGGHFWPAIKPTVNATLFSGSCGGTMCTWLKLVCTVLQIAACTESSNRLQESASAHDRVATPSSSCSSGIRIIYGLSHPTCVTWTLGSPSAHGVLRQRPQLATSGLL